MKRGITLILSLVMLCSVLLMPTYAVSFSDLDSGHWAYEYITTLADQGVINGYTDGTFRPSGTITRAEFIKLITVATCGEEEANKIVVPSEHKLFNKWYGKYVYWGEQKNVLVNYWLPAEWEMPISRIQMVEILFSYANYLGMFDVTIKEDIEDDEGPNREDGMRDLILEATIIALNEMGYKNLKIDKSTLEDTEKIIKDFSEDEMYEFYEKQSIAYEDLVGIKDIHKEEKPIYNDLEDISDSEETFLKEVSKLKLINGYEDGSFKPYKNMSRAEVSTIIYRYNNKK